jgi:shikimate kinase
MQWMKFCFYPLAIPCQYPLMKQEGPQVQHIILIGFMGCGKSTVGRELKRMLGYAWVDTDAVIEAQAHCSISDIFAREGESGFRDRETQVLRDLAASQTRSTIISTGGGAVLREENRLLLRQLGYVVWLRANPETVYQRTRKNRDRPILQTANPRAVIAELLQQREPIYRECAHLAIDVSGLNRTEIAVGIIESARYHFASQE